MGFTTEQEDELWIRWRRGESSRLIDRTLRCHPSSVRAFRARSGGVRPTPRRRSIRHLTATEREEVSRGIAAGLSARDRGVERPFGVDGFVRDDLPNHLSCRPTRVGL